MSASLPGTGLWPRALAVVRREGVRGLARRLADRGTRGSHAAWESARWAAWRWGGGDQVTINGYRMHLDRNDPGISRELALYGTHEPLATEKAIHFAATARTILDLGSNIGYYALLFLTRVNPRPRLIAVEPSSGNLTRLRRNLAANGFSDAATVLQVAVSDRCGEGRLHLARESNWHTLLPADERHQGSESVPIVTLDALVQQQKLSELDLVRMDIEGYEAVVFRGMDETLRKLRPRLIVEFHPQLIGAQPVTELLSRLQQDYGYRAEHVVDRELDYAHLQHRASPLRLDSLLREDLSHRCFTVFLRVG